MNIVNANCNGSGGKEFTRLVYTGHTHLYWLFSQLKLPEYSMLHAPVSAFILLEVLYLGVPFLRVRRVERMKNSSFFQNFQHFMCLVHWIFTY